MAAHLYNNTESTVYSGKWAIDGMEIDEHHSRLYWTAYNNASGHIARMSIVKGLDTYKVVVDGLDSPRAIVIHPKKR